MPKLDEIGAGYIQLAFRIAQHVPGYIDSYFGPPGLERELREEPRRPAGLLVAEAQALRERLERSGYAFTRRGYLDRQLRAMETTCRLLAGEQISYLEEVRCCFDISPELIPEQRFEQAIEELQTLLPGPGSIQERRAAWRSQLVVPPSLAPQLIERIAEEGRARTRALYGLPEGEQVEFRLVKDQPWRGYNWYLGDARSAVDINTDLPIYANELAELVCHEAYPGHHTEHSLKEQRLWMGRGYAEHSIQLINTPECVIAEGIAKLASQIIFSGPAGDLYDWQARELYPLAGIAGDPQRERRIGQAIAALEGVAGNAALLLHEHGASAEESVAYLQRYALSSEAEARKRLSFLQSPLWRAYIFSYFYGEHLLGEWLGRGDTTERFGTLLREQIYPTLVEQWNLEESAACGLRT